ncbi:hypothetical protein OG705_28485 [Streptomyces sp. NBC_00838]|uniref:hypothetical protein n=1 Tax=Streptomyces sp. NBC_00838 TaxID=2903680 RepID=UPI003870522A|nr:hypothetical protein OG705_28485 [Streptomyces sp. NBC_00838]
MGESVPVRCPDCGHSHVFSAAAYPCPCGTAVAAPLVAGAPPIRIVRRTWADEWVTVSCTGCGRYDEWPQPELGCPCGALLRIPVRPVTAGAGCDAVNGAAHYLREIGFPDVLRSGERPEAGVDLRGPGIVAQVDLGPRPADSRAVECLWLSALTESAVSAFFSLAGYTDEARERADTLGVPLFLLDPTGVPRPVNGPAAELDRSHA